MPRRAFALFFAALPFAFALFRAVRTGDDFRYLWVALAAAGGAAAVVIGARPFSRTPRGVLLVSAAVFVGATLLAIVAAMALGTKLGLGILVVAASFGFCFAAGPHLWTRFDAAPKVSS